MLGGMAWVGESNLAAAVSNAGGLGTLGSGAMSTEKLREEIRLCREKTRLPFAVNLLLLDTKVEEKIQIVIEENVAVAIFGAGNPGKLIQKCKEAGMITMGVVSSENLAILLERAGIDFIVGEGCESGGHIGTVTTFVLIPKLIDVLSIPVIAAGGIADGRGVAGAFMLGAQGVQVGTRFIASTESQAHAVYKDLLLKAGIRDTVVTGEKLGHPVRVLKTRFSKQILKLEQQSQEEAEKLLMGSFSKAYQDGNIEEGSFLAGQSAGLIHKISTCTEIITEMFDQAQRIIATFNHI